MANYILETALNADGSNIIAGVDEVGRGPWAGPVTVCAVILDPDNIPEGLNDSKKLTAKRRDVLFDLIMGSAEVSLVHVEVEEIDQINILQATFRGMERAVAGLPSVDHILIDGNKTPPNLNAPATAVVKGDGKSVSIAAASIIAKVTRDRLMLDLSKSYPGYGWETNAGYGTKIHQSGLLNHGVTPHHRRSFKPIHNILYPA
jgi:ribonuclease HII